VKERGGGWLWSSGTVSGGARGDEPSDKFEDDCKGSCGRCVAGLSLEVGQGCEGVGGVVGSSSLSGDGDGCAIVVVGG
jgi:hypothetical protein